MIRVQCIPLGPRPPVLGTRTGSVVYSYILYGFGSSTHRFEFELGNLYGGCAWLSSFRATTELVVNNLNKHAHILQKEFQLSCWSSTYDASISYVYPLRLSIQCYYWCRLPQGSWHELRQKSALCPTNGQGLCNNRQKAELLNGSLCSIFSVCQPHCDSSPLHCHSFTQPFTLGYSDEYVDITFKRSSCQKERIHLRRSIHSLHKKMSNPQNKLETEHTI